jgi:GTPase
MNKHYSGFINIIGQPNVGKSTLTNALVGERLSIINKKPQTTRHRIIGIVSGDDFQMVFSDTPGFINNPHYKMQEKMNAFVETSFEDGDVMILVIDPLEADEAVNARLLEKLQQKATCPAFLVINKIDLLPAEKVAEVMAYWQAKFNFNQSFAVSALNKQNTEQLFEALRQVLPEGHEYYPKEQLTDKPERFFVGEIVREKILELYHQEIPYSCEVSIHTFKEDPDESRNLVRIYGYIFVSRQTQKEIVIGKGGSAIKRLGIAAREDIEKFLDKKVFLELIVKVREDWRDDELSLKRFGYAD